MSSLHSPKGLQETLGEQDELWGHIHALDRGHIVHSYLRRPKKPIISLKGDDIER